MRMSRIWSEKSRSDNSSTTVAQVISIQYRMFPSCASSTLPRGTDTLQHFDGSMIDIVPFRGSKPKNITAYTDLIQSGHFDNMLVNVLPLKEVLNSTGSFRRKIDGDVALTFPQRATS